jgi:hypothetical protein
MVAFDRVGGIGDTILFENHAIADVNFRYRSAPINKKSRAFARLL